jgi:hypothetical protein
MSASPFRSHLLQQWARSTQGRAPAAVVPWLNKSSSSHPREIDREDDERRLLEREYLAHLHPESTHITPPSISTLDSASTVTAFAATTVSSSLWARPPAKAPQNNSIRRSQSRDGSGRTSSDAIISAKLASRVSEEHRGTSGGSRSLHSTPPHPSSSSYRQEYDLTEQEQNIAHDSELAASFQSFLQSRRTATRLQSEEEEEQQRKILIPALNRAVQCAQMAPNHKRTEPFSFRRFVAGSEAARQLADISYEVTLRKTESHPNAESKRQKWLQIPAFLVTLVHGNQAGIDDIESSSDNDPYQALPYTPPETEKQLEDVSTNERRGHWYSLPPHYLHLVVPLPILYTHSSIPCGTLF